MAAPMPAPRLPRSGPLRCSSGPAACRPPEGRSGAAPGSAGRQVFRIPDFQVPTHAARARQDGAGAAGELETWEPGDLTRALHALLNADVAQQRKRSTNEFSRGAQERRDESGGGWNDWVGLRAETPQVACRNELIVLTQQACRMQLL